MTGLDDGLNQLSFEELLALLGRAQMQREYEDDPESRPRDGQKEWRLIRAMAEVSLDHSDPGVREAAEAYLRDYGRWVRAFNSVLEGISAAAVALMGDDIADHEKFDQLLVIASRPVGMHMAAGSPMADSFSRLVHLVENDKPLDGHGGDSR